MIMLNLGCFGNAKGALPNVGRPHGKFPSEEAHVKLRCEVEVCRRGGLFLSERTSCAKKQRKVGVVSSENWKELIVTRVSRGEWRDVKLESSQFLKYPVGVMKGFGLYPKGSGSHWSIWGRKWYNYVCICDNFTCNLRNDVREEGSIFGKVTC